MSTEQTNIYFSYFFISTTVAHNISIIVFSMVLAGRSKINIFFYRKVLLQVWIVHYICLVFDIDKTLLIRNNSKLKRQISFNSKYHRKNEINKSINGMLLITKIPCKHRSTNKKLDIVISRPFISCLAVQKYYPKLLINWWHFLK